MNRNDFIKCWIIRTVWVFLAFFSQQLYGQQTDTMPAINAEIVTYLKTVIGKKVDRGECWDLANEALSKTNADWEFPTKFGKEIDPIKEQIFPGDLIQFTKVKAKNDANETWYFPVHTAIVYEVLAPGVLKIAQQNVGGKRKVQIDTLSLKDIISGKIQIYRPIRK